MSSLDIILAVVVVWGFYQGWSNGIIQTVFTVLSYFFGLLLAFKLTPSTTRFLQDFFKSDNPLMMVAGFLVVFVGVMLVFRFAARGLENAFNFAQLGMLNSLAGGALLAFIYTALFSVLVWFANKANLIGDETKQAICWPLLEKLPPKAQAITKQIVPYFKEFYNSSLNMVDRLEKYGGSKTESRQKIYDLPDAPEGEKNVIELDPDDAATDDETNR